MVDPRVQNASVRQILVLSLLTPIPSQYRARNDQSVKRLKTLREAHGDQLKDINIKDPEVRQSLVWC